MALTPVEIRHVRLGRGLLGYRRGAVDGLLGEVAESFESVWRDRADLADRVEALESDLKRHKELEELLRATLVSAQRSAAELKEQAGRDADAIVAEAHAEARAVTRRATAERERLESELRRIRALLRAASESVEEAVPEPRAVAEAPGDVRRLVS